MLAVATRLSYTRLCYSIYILITWFYTSPLTGTSLFSCLSSIPALRLEEEQVYGRPFWPPLAFLGWVGSIPLCPYHMVHHCTSSVIGHVLTLNLEQPPLFKRG